jgi:hypothetical protein
MCKLPPHLRKGGASLKSKCEERDTQNARSLPHRGLVFNTTLGIFVTYDLAFSGTLDCDVHFRRLSRLGPVLKHPAFAWVAYRCNITLAPHTAAVQMLAQSRSPYTHCFTTCAHRSSVQVQERRGSPPPPVHEGFREGPDQARARPAPSPGPASWSGGWLTRGAVARRTATRL